MGYLRGKAQIKRKGSMKEFFVKDLVKDQEITEFFMAKTVAIKVGANGKQYMDIMLSDKTGDVTAKKWDVSDAEYPTLKAIEDKSIVKIKGIVTEWAGQLQVRVQRIRVANLLCRDVVATGRAPYTNWIGRMQPEDEAIVMQSLEKVGMASYALRTMDKMSDGECQRVMIARALAQQTPVILLDEPTSFLDMPNRYALCRLLADLAHEENKCIIFSTHELDIAQSLCDTIALIDSPNMHHLPTPEMISSGHIEKLFQMS